MSTLFDFNSTSLNYSIHFDSNLRQADFIQTVVLQANVQAFHLNVYAFCPPLANAKSWIANLLVFRVVKQLRSKLSTNKQSVLEDIFIHSFRLGIKSTQIE